ncbi:MAG: TenA family protein [Kiloniellales bacterium]|nr:TenA family protein [Kiloniellales bacterium]
MRKAAGNSWQRAIDHAFTRELAEDILPEERYREYLIQDYAFIDVLARVLGFAIAQAPDMPPKSRLSAFLAAVTSEENDYFLRSFEALGVSKSDWQDAKLTGVMRDLADLMLPAARDQGYEGALAVLLPAEWIYLTWATAQAGKRPSRFYYREWIDLHASPEFEAFVSWLRDETDRTAAALPDDRRVVMQDLFLHMVDLESAFFDEVYQKR